MSNVSISDIETQIERLLTKYDSLNLADIFLEFRGYDHSAIAAALDNLIQRNRISVKDDKGLKTYKKSTSFIASFQFYGTNSRL